jgi:prepilin-type N-terminal cleavage/methylation domain-containing protein
VRIHLIAYRLKRSNKGLTLIELLLAMAISAILTAGLYRTFIGQHKTYVVQEQVVDMQQNVRVAISRMMREIRMAGFGNVSDVLETGGVNGFSKVVTPEGSDKITIVGGFKQIRRDNGDPIVVDSASGNQVTLNYATDEFDKEPQRYICIGGIESNTVQSRTGAKLTLNSPLKLSHPQGTPIFKIHAIMYGLRDDGGVRVLFRDLYPNTVSSQRDTVAENIENVQFEYFDADGNPTAIPANIRMVRVTVTARTGMSDPEFKGGAGGFRRRTIASNILVRNMGVNP